MDEDIKKMEELLKRVEKPEISSMRRGLLRTNLMEELDRGKEGLVSRSLTAVRGYVKQSSNLISLSVSQKVLLKERVFAAIKGGECKRGFFVRYSLLVKRMTSGALAASMVLGMVSLAAVDVNVAFADSITQVEFVFGEVEVVRGEESISAFDGMELLEGDEVKTSENSFASITFLDDSVLRMAGNTGLNINTLYEGLDNNEETYVEVEVVTGSVWSRVLNLFGEDSAFVVKVGDFLAKAQKAAFNVTKDEVETALEVYHHMLDIETSTEETKVKSGEKVVSDSVSKPRVTKMEGGLVQDQWVQDNLEDDKVYVAKVNEKKKEDREDIAQSGLHPFKSLKTGVQKLITFDDISQQKLEFQAVQRDFVEVEVALESGEMTAEEVKGVLDSFVEEVDRFKMLVANVRENGDDEYADELKLYLDTELVKYKKDLASILPDSPLYAAKEVVMVAEVAAAEDGMEEVIVKSSQAVEKVSEAADLTEAGEDELAAEAIENSAEAIVDTKKDLDNLSKEDKEEVLQVFEDMETEVSDVVSTMVDFDETVVEGGFVEVVEVLPEPEVQSHRVSDYGVQVVDTKDGEKPLDPLLNLDLN